MSWYLIPEECDPEAIIASGRAMTAEEATEIIRRVEAKVLSIIHPDAMLAYAVLMQAWAKPLGLTLVPDGWWRLMGLKERYHLPLFMPSDRKSKFAFTLWAWRGEPACYVSCIRSPPRSTIGRAWKRFVASTRFNLPYSTGPAGRVPTTAPSSSGRSSMIGGPSSPG
ncbi:MAG TPA: hypothetical protein VN668_03250 [Stellaceae bacterium]|nr:hypothetical protein [Stellaceae bacterium]